MNVMLDKERKPAMSNAAPSASAAGGLGGCMAGEEDSRNSKRLGQLPSESVVLVRYRVHSVRAPLCCLASR